MSIIHKIFGIKKKLKLSSKDAILLPGIERAVLWDYRQDSIPVNDYIRTLRNLEWEIRYCRNRYPEEHRRLKLIKHNMMEEYESKIDRIWNDQKAGTYFRNGDKFEPYQAVKVKNLVMWDGITAFTEIIAGESTDYFRYKAEGTDPTAPNFSQESLLAEVARVDMNLEGDINSDGIVLKDTAAFPPTIPTNTICEFAAFNRATSGTMEYRTTIERVEDRLAHVQNVTIVQSSHSIVFQAVENRIT